MDAVVFPGQGSQKPGMGAPWTDTPSWEVVGRIEGVLDRDVAALLVDADADTLKQTRNAQVAAFALGAVLIDAARRAGLTWTAAAGHSLGEYTALVAAHILDLEPAAQLVGVRADAMQQATDAAPGTMAAIIGLDQDAVAACCDGDEVWVANDNAPGQIVVAGTPAGVEGAAAAAREKRGRVMPLAVGGAFHTPLMAPAQPLLDQQLGATTFADSDLPVVANVDAADHRDGSDWPDLLGRQLCGTVRWREDVLTLRRLGVTRIVELGPGGVLAGMVKRIAPDIETLSIGTPADLPA